MPKHVILVGLPGAGKTTVGPLAAHDLGMAFVDIDPLIEERFGAPVTEIFSTRGERAFRRLEGELVAQALEAGAPQLIAPGGGWAAQPGNLESVAGRATTVYLVATPETASARAGSGTHRPLLDEPGGDREKRMRELYRQRRRFYSRCDTEVETDERTPAEVAEVVVQLARSMAR
jgi:shikimate kinase